MTLFGQDLRGRTALVGVVHLLPLPGGPRGSPGRDAVLARAIDDAAILVDGGADGIIVENLGDVPFAKGRVAAATVAAMTVVAERIARTLPDDVALGVNVLRNDALSALGIAAAVGARFVRINVHVGAMVTDQGVIEGEAHATLAERARLGADVRIAADVLVKHAVPLGPWSLEDAARDTVERGLADAVIATGTGTGRPTDPEEVRRMQAAVPHTPVWVGSGLDPEQLATFPPFAAAIVGTWLHRDGRLDAPLDPDRVRRMRDALR
jgi:membrane complex biogenesis BtpA family protein